jgi:acetylornithine/succinyldiaminopimelate/putrescine aminotransferase
MHVSNLFATDKVAEAAVKINALLAETTGSVAEVFFCNSGAEANETALKLARKFGGRGRHGVVSAFGSFHGRTLAALAATGQPAKHEPFFPMPDGFRHVPYNDIAALEASIDTTVAAVLLEPVQGEGGVVPTDDQYLRDVRAVRRRSAVHARRDPDRVRAQASGSVQTPGGARRGPAWRRRWAMGSRSVRRGRSASRRRAQPATTAAYSGTALATAVVGAVIDETQDRCPWFAAKKAGILLRQVAELPGVAGRGRGLLLAAELADGRDAKAAYSELLDHGLVTNAVTATSLRFAPPLTVTEAELDEAIAIIGTVLR